MQKKWNILKADEAACDLLQQGLKIHPALCKILVQRGIKTFDEAKHFFRPSLDRLYDPWLMKDMEIATERILLAICNKEKILVFGDYDVDGTTSVACMTSFLREIYDPAYIEFYIPHRYREGYGVSKAGIDFAVKEQYSLIISLDCGIKSIDLVEYARQLGIDFIICDHHLPDDVLPSAVAILNPKQPGCAYPFKDLCGCGVGFKLICALCQRLGLPNEIAFKYLDLVATAIAADIVTLVDENRILAFYGLKKANTDPNYGIKALMQLSGVKSELLISSLVFMIAPRINAAGRMDDARKAVYMFIADTYAQSLHYAEMLHADNFDRKEADQSITREALQLIQDNLGLTSRKSTVLYQAHWHKGVVGIVASRLMDHYYRPTIVLTQSGGYVAGSARSVAGFNVYEAIHQCRDLLLGYGGHFYAAGLTMRTENISAFQDRFETVVAASITEELLIPEIIIDAEADMRSLSAAFYNILRQMEPFGPANARPVFILKQVYNTGHSKIVRENHIKFSLTQDHFTFTGIGFNLASKFHLLEQQLPIDVIFTLEENDWNNQKSLQLRVIDLRL